MSNKFLYSELQKLGKKIAKIDGNRPIDIKNVKDKKKSMTTYGALSNITYMEAKTLIKQGYKVVDWHTGNEITPEEAENYLVIIDGQHRTQAHLELLKEYPEYKFDLTLSESLNPEADAGLQLCEMNTVQKSWGGKEMGHCAKAMVKDKSTPTLDYVAELTGKGYSLPAASLFATFGDKVNSGCLKKAVNGNMPDILKDNSNLEYGKKVHDAAMKHFSADFIKGRTLASWIGAKFKDREGGKQEFVEQITAFFNTIDHQVADDIEKIRGVRGGDTKETLINKRLNEMYKAFLEEEADSATE